MILFKQDLKQKVHDIIVNNSLIEILIEEVHLTVCLSVRISVVTVRTWRRRRAQLAIQPRTMKST